MAEPLEKTFALIKPDAVRAGKEKEIMQLIELNGFTIIAKQKLQLTRSRAEEFYGEHKGKPFFPRLVEFMTSGPIWALVLARPGAIKAWRDLMGPTNVFTARAEKPKCLRALYGTDGTQNATHGSDAPGSAAREIKFFFPQLALEPVTEPAVAGEYITSKLQPALAKALAALAREKPSADKFEAITFIANYLLQNNPNKPKVLLPDEWDPSIMGDDDDDEAEFANAKPAARPAEGDANGQAEFDAMLQAAKMDTGKPAPAQNFEYHDDAAAPRAATPPTAAAREARPPSGGARPPSASARPPSAGAARPPSANGADPAAEQLQPRPPSAQVARPPSGGERPASARPTSARPGSARPPSSGGRPPSASQHAAPIEEGAEGDPAQWDEAATKVQAAFRGYQARKEVAVMRAQAGPGVEAQVAVEASSGEAPMAEPSGAAEGEGEMGASASGLDSLLLPEGVTPEMAEAAATRVQAHMRGHLARRQVAALKAGQVGGGDSEAVVMAEGGEEAAPAPEASLPEPEAEPQAEAEAEPQAEATEGEPQPDLGASASELDSLLPEGVTPEMAEAAATRVQAHMRGHLARRQVAALRAGQAAAAPGGEASEAVEMGEPSMPAVEEGGEVSYSQGEAAPEQAGEASYAQEGEVSYSQGEGEAGEAEGEAAQE